MQVLTPFAPFDEVGNLKQRIDEMQMAPGGGSLIEDFSYDELNRLESATIAGIGSNAYQYDAIGNLTHKSDVSAADYVYDDGTGRPHAVKTAGGNTYNYDANGSMTSGGGRTLGYTSFNKPNSIAKGATSLTFLYGADRARVKQVRTDSNGTQTTYYVGNYEKIVKTGVTIQRHTITAGGRRIGIYTTRTNGINDLRYLHTDHQGSLNAITDENRNVVERFSFDAFGRVRKADWTYDPVGNLISSVTSRGCTGHEQLNDVGLIHMNGRVYDPTLGRFASADPFIQAAANPQSLNRYSYVLNNPLSYTDPSGYFFKKLFKKAKRFVKKYGRAIVAAVAAYYVGTWVKGYFQGLADAAVGYCGTTTSVGAVAAGGAAAGFTAGAITTGTLRGAVTGAVSGGLAGAVAGHFGNNYSFERVATDSFVGGINAELNGGKFKEGFLGTAYVSGMTLLNVRLREFELAHSGKTAGQVGLSGGFRGLMGKLGGGRLVDRVWGEIRAFSTSFEDALSTYFDSQTPSAMGGHQGSSGMISVFGYKIRYEAGGVLDYIVEGFAGIHDALNHRFHYNDSGPLIGTVKHREGFGRFAGEALNYGNVLLAAPVAIPSLIPDHMRHMFIK